ncbi:MAG: histidine kinase [Pseudomonadota bacterium]
MAKQSHIECPQSTGRRVVPDLDWQTYWKFQIVFWISVYIWRTVFTLASGYGMTGFGVRIISVLLSILVTVLLSKFIARFVGDPIRWWQFVVITITTLALGLAHTVVDRLMYATWRNGWSPALPSRAEFQSILSVNLWVFASWTGFFLVILLMTRSERQRSAVERLNQFAHEAKLELLTSQLKPHFLLNTLNAVSALIAEGRNRDADIMLARLGRFLRRVLRVEQDHKTTVADEVAMLNDYLEIQKVRLGDRLSYRFDIDPDCEAQRTPALILQPLVENAVKHAVAQNVEGGSIEVSAQAGPAGLMMSVTDNGGGFDTSAPRKGQGLSIVEERLDAHYGDGASLTIQSGIGRGTTILMHLPPSTVPLNPEVNR